MLGGGILVLKLPGGEIFGAYSGTEGPGDEPDQVAITGTITFTGGTGKFQKITGSAGFSSVATITNISNRAVVKENLTLSFDGVLANINAQ